MRTLTLLMAGAAILLGSAEAQVGGVVDSTTGTVDETVGTLQQTVPGTLNPNGSRLVRRGASRLDAIAERRARREARRLRREAQADGATTVTGTAETTLGVDRATQTVDAASEARLASDADIETRRVTGSGRADVQSASEVVANPEGANLDARRTINMAAAADARTPELGAARSRIVSTTRQTGAQVGAQIQSLPAPSVPDVAVAVPQPSATITTPGRSGYSTSRTDVVVIDNTRRVATQPPEPASALSTASANVQASSPTRTRAQTVRTSSSANGSLGANLNQCWLPVLMAALLIALLLAGARRFSQR